MPLRDSKNRAIDCGDRDKIDHLNLLEIVASGCNRGFFSEVSKEALEDLLKNDIAGLLATTKAEWISDLVTSKDTYEDLRQFQQKNSNEISARITALLAD